MNTYTNKSKERYEKIIQSFPNIPENRKVVNEQNLLWFLRQGSILNRNNHKNVEAIQLAQSLLQQQQ